jgi:uncharacterized protein
MPERDGYIPGVPCWADASEPDAEAVIDFYGRLFGWEFEDMMPPDTESEYFVARLRGLDVVAVRSIPEGAPPIAMWNTYVWVESADQTASKVLDAGGKALIDPYDARGAGRMAMFADPEGATFWVQQAKNHKGARVVNEAGSLVFNGLNTRDVEGAKSFYGSVFGWQTMTLESGAEMWTMPGYGDHLEQGNPGLRKQMAEVGAPAGFEDAVGSVNPIPDDQPDLAAHWSVTFSVDDADATAAKATELGGEVIVAPFDAPWVRMTVIADTHGATFNVSTLVPENRDLASYFPRK